MRKLKVSGFSIALFIGIAAFFPEPLCAKEVPEGLTQQECLKKGVSGEFTGPETGECLKKGITKEECNGITAKECLEKGISLVKGKNLEAAKNAFKEVLKITPDSPIARSYLYNFDYEMAEQELSKVIKSRLHLETTAYAYLQRGISCHARGKYESAVEDFGNAIEINPKLRLAYWYRYLCYTKKQVRNGAEEMKDLESAAKLGLPEARKVLEELKGQEEAAQRGQENLL